MESNTLVPGKGFWVPVKEIKGTGSQLFCVFCTDPDGGGNDYMFLVAGENEDEANEVAEQYALAFFNEEDGDWTTEDFTIFIQFIGNAI